MNTCLPAWESEDLGGGESLSALANKSFVLNPRMNREDIQVNELAIIVAMVKHLYRSYA